VVEVLLDNESTVIGALADSVEEVIDLDPDQIEPAPRIGTRIRTEFIKGMGKRDSQFIMILDIDRVFSAEELAVVRGRNRRRSSRTWNRKPSRSRRAEGRQAAIGGSGRVRREWGRQIRLPRLHNERSRRKHFDPGLTRAFAT